MTKGLDTVRQLSQSMLNAVPADREFIGRYYSREKPEKRLTVAEAECICDSGHSIFSIYQDANNYASAFHTENGLYDADYAWKYAQSVGQPTNTPIYFAVDFDVDDPAPGETKKDTLKRIYDYFKAIQGQFAIWNNKGALNYKIGVYGCGEICQYIKQDCGLATYSFLARSKGWSGYDDYNYPSKYNLKQIALVSYGGVDFDTVESGNGSFGSWRV